MNVAKVGKQLRSFATHHHHGEGWTYTRDTHGIKHIRYNQDWAGYNSPWRRVARAFSPNHLLSRDAISKSIGWNFSWRYAWAWIVVNLRTERHLPDGTLNDGIVMVVWEEDGEYIEWVGPTVGEKIADFLENDPENPYAIAIATEMHRVRQLGIDRRKAERE